MYYSTFVQGAQCKYKQFDACRVLACNQQKYYIFVNIDEYKLFDILLLLFMFLIFSLVFNHFVIFHIFFGKYTLILFFPDQTCTVANYDVYKMLFVLWVFVWINFVSSLCVVITPFTIIFLIFLLPLWLRVDEKILLWQSSSA